MGRTAQRVRSQVLQSSGCWKLASGARVVIRVLRPGDAAGVQAYVRRLSTQSRYNRYFGALAELPTRELDLLTRMRLPHRLALLAETADRPVRRVIGETVYVASDASTGEFALSVADEFRRQGLGTLLMSVLECTARTLGATRLVGDVLRTNTAMLRLAMTAGFRISRGSDDPRVVRLAKDVWAPGPDAECGNVELGLARAA